MLGLRNLCQSDDFCETQCRKCSFGVSGNAFQRVFLSRNRHGKRNQTSNLSVVDKKRKLNNGCSSNIVNEEDFHGHKCKMLTKKIDLDKENIQDVQSNENKPVVSKNVQPFASCRPKLRSFSLDTNIKNYEQLTSYMIHQYNRIRQSDRVYQQKVYLRERLFHLLKTAGVDLYIVGSTHNGTATYCSDLDLCLVFKRVHEKDAILQAKKVLLRIKNILPQAFDKASLVNAKVPLLRFIDTKTGIRFDLNINNTVGIRNTRLVYSYTRLDNRVAPLIVITKLWARQNHINDAYKKTLSSYNYVLLVIHFLQYGCNPPVLPCLQAMLPHEFSPTSDIKNLNLHINLPAYESKNKETLGELFLNFLFYFGYKFAYHRDVVSVRTGGTIPKSEVAKNSNRRWNFICVEEPFTRNNTAQAIYDENAFDFIVKTFRRSYLFAAIYQDQLFCECFCKSVAVEEVDAIR